MAKTSTFSLPMGEDIHITQAAAKAAWLQLPHEQKAILEDLEEDGLLDVFADLLTVGLQSPAAAIEILGTMDALRAILDAAIKRQGPIPLGSQVRNAIHDALFTVLAHAYPEKPAKQ